MNNIKKIILICSILLLSIGCDQVTKNAAQQSLSSSAPLSFVGNILRLEYTQNRGAFLSLGYNWPDSVRFLFLMVVPLLLLLTILFLLFKSNKFDHLTICAFACILGGGFSNMWDRAFNNGFVVDFINLGIGNIRTGIFNFADVFLMIGAGLLLYKTLRMNFKAE